MGRRSRLPQEQLTQSGSGTQTIDCKEEYLQRSHVKVTGTTTIDVSNTDCTNVLFLVVEQDATGGHAVTFSAAFVFETPAPTLTTAANSIDSFVFVRHNGKFYQHAFAKDVK
jgi:hypothetical protein